MAFACFSLQTRYVRSIDSLSCADSEGHRPKIIGAPIRLDSRERERGGGDVCEILTYFAIDATSPSDARRVLQKTRDSSLLEKAAN
jgi:hypothetical protein